MDAFLDNINEQNRSQRDRNSHRTMTREEIEKVI